MAFGGRRGFGGGGFGSNRRGTFGQKRNNPWGTNQRNKQADEQKRRKREADKRKREDEKRRRKLEQDKKRQLEKKKQRELDKRLKLEKEKRLREQAKLQKIYDRRDQNGSLEKRIRENKKVAKVNQQEKRQQNKQEREKLVSSNRKVRDERQYQKSYQYKRENRNKQIQRIKENKGLTSAFSTKKMKQQKIKHLEMENRKTQIRENTSKSKESFHAQQTVRKKQLSNLNSSIRTKQQALRDMKYKNDISPSGQRNMNREIIELRQERQITYFQQEKNERLFKQAQAISKQELKVSRYEAEKARIDKKLFITPAAKKRQMESLDRYIAKEKGKLNQLKNTSDHNKRTYEIQEKLALSKKDTEVTKIKIDNKKAELEEKFNKRISQASTVSEREDLIQKKEDTFRKLDERKRDIVDKHEELVINSQQKLKEIKNEHNISQKNLEIEKNKAVLKAKIQDYEREYQELRKPPIFETQNSKAARQHMIMKNRQQVQALRNQYENTETQVKMERTVKAHTPSTVREEIDAMRNTDSYKQSKREHEHYLSQQQREMGRMVDREERLHNDNQRYADKEMERLQQEYENEAQKFLDAEEKREAKRKQIVEQENKKKEEEQRLYEEQYAEAMRQKEETEADALRQEHEMYMEQQRQEEQNRLFQEQSQQQFEAQEQQRQSFSREQKKEYLEEEKQRILSKSELSEEDFLRIAELENDINDLVG